MQSLQEAQKDKCLLKQLVLFASCFLCLFCTFRAKEDTSSKRKYEQK